MTICSNLRVHWYSPFDPYTSNAHMATNYCRGSTCQLVSSSRSSELEMYQKAWFWAIFSYTCKQRLVLALFVKIFLLFEIIISLNFVYTYPNTICINMQLLHIKCLYKYISAIQYIYVKLSKIYFFIKLNETFLRFFL